MKRRITAFTLVVVIMIMVMPVQKVNATAVPAAGTLVAEMVTYFLATSGAAVGSALIADGVDTSGMTAVDVASFWH